MVTTKNKFSRPISELRALVAERTVDCFECWQPVRKNGPNHAEVLAFDSPFQDEGTTIHIHANSVPNREDYDYSESCSERLEDQSWADFRYFNCEHCGRFICRQNPSQGYMTQVRTINDCEEICLRCYETYVLENGIDLADVLDGRLPGMFFSGDNHEPLDAGYELVVENTSDTDRLLRLSKDYINRAFKVVIGYESMGIGGGGYASLFVKDAGED